MKIEEILGELKLNPRISNKSTSGVLKSPKLQFIAAGCQAIAYYHKTHPNTVVKVAAVSGEGDPIWQFLRICINHKNNPYFPKIFNYKIFNLSAITDEEEEYLENDPAFEYLPIHDNRKMQILMVTEHLNEITEAQFEQSLNKLGLDKLIEFTKRQWQPSYSYPLTTEMIWQMLMDKSIGRKYLRSKSNDKYFSDAIRLLSPLIATGRMYADVHLGNMMLRKDGHLVFNDPLAITMTGDTD
jgi:hypothetical protein